MIFDETVKNVINSAYETETDVFLRMEPPCYGELASDGIKTAVFLPGSFIPTENSFFYDIRSLGDDNFRESLRTDNVKRIVLLFSECADKGEYGYRESFGWIGEMRAENNGFIQLVAFFSPDSDSFEVCSKLFLCKDLICLGEKASPDFNVLKTSSAKAKFYRSAELAEKYAFKRSAVYFNSREEARSFSRFLENRGTRCVYFDGSLSPEAIKTGIDGFTSGRINILVTTKAYIPTSYFHPPDRVIFCGVPFSSSHLGRCVSFLKGEKPFVIYCEDDIKRNEKIIASFSEKLCDGEISVKRKDRLDEMVKMLIIKEK